MESNIGLSLLKDLGDTKTYSVSLQILFVMTALTLLPAIILAMTSFTRLIIVLSILRQALGMPQTPSNQILVGLSLFMTVFIMSPVINEANKVGLKPYIDNKIDFTTAIEKGQEPFKNFMLHHTRENDLALFKSLANESNEAEPPLSVLVPAFVTSELKTAFQIGFLIFIPFLIIDLVVASVLMSMGMMMLSPLIISLPFKLMLFVMVDGWALLMGTLAGSFNT